MADYGIVDYPISYRGLTLNEHRNTDGTIDETKTADTILIERFDFSPIQFRDQRDGLHLMYGGDLGVVSSEFRFLSMQGRVLGSTWAKLEDKIAGLNAAFHPEIAVYDSPSTRGLDVLDFYCPTEEAGYSPLAHEVFLGRPTGLPATFERRSSGLVVPFAAELICTPPGRYLYTPQSVVVNSANSWSASVPNWTASKGYPVFPTLTIVLTGTGSSALTIRYVEGSTTTDLVLDCSGLSASAHTIVWDLATGTALEGSTRQETLRTSIVTTGSFPFGPGGGTLSVPSGRTALTSVTAAYRQARA